LAVAFDWSGYLTIAEELAKKTDEASSGARSAGPTTMSII